MLCTCGQYAVKSKEVFEITIDWLLWLIGGRAAVCGMQIAL